ncbi:lipase, class 3 [Tanacetum coccineum]
MPDSACMTWELAESDKHVIATIINGLDLVPTFSTASIDDLRTRVLNVVFHSATSLGSRLPSMANARAKVAGACAMLRPVSSSTQGKTLRMKDNKYAFKAVKAAGVTSIRVRGKDAVCVVTQNKAPSSADAGQAFGFNQCYTSVRVTKFVGLLATSTTGYSIPSGWVIMISHATHLNTDTYKDPFDFNPWRWEEGVAI